MVAAGEGLWVPPTILAKDWVPLSRSATGRQQLVQMGARYTGTYDFQYGVDARLAQLEGSAGSAPVLEAASASTSIVGTLTQAGLPPLPHPDASNLGLGPNLGGSDAVAYPGEAQPQGPAAEDETSGLGGVFLIGGAILLIAMLAKR